MGNPVSRVLDKAGLYRPLKRAFRYVTDGERRQREREIRADLALTRQQVGSWAGTDVQNEGSTRYFAILSFTNVPFHAKFQCLVAKTMQLQGYTPLIFTQRNARYAHQYFELFGIDELVIWEDLVEQLGPDESELRALSEGLLPPYPTVKRAVQCQFHGVDVGKHALSVTSRGLIRGHLDLKEPETHAIFVSNLRRAIGSVVAAETFLEKYNVEKMLVRDAGYIPHGAIFESALSKGVDCVVYEHGQRWHTWILKRYTMATKGEHYFSISMPTWEQVRSESWIEANDALLQEMFRRRYQPDSMEDTRRLQSGKTLKTPAELQQQLGLDPARKTAVIFSHIAWDAAFFFGDSLFDDFEHWLFETVCFVARECPQVNWLVKLHPYNVFKIREEGKSEESEMRLLRALMPLPDHVRILRADTDINTWSLFPLVDYVLTVNGTVGMEFPCFGVPAILAGTGRYNGRGFTIEPSSREEYFATLKQIENIPRLDQQTQRLARRHFLALTRRQYSLEDVAPMDLRRKDEGDRSRLDSIQFTSRSLTEFENAHSIKRLAEWLSVCTTPDLMDEGELLS